MKSPLFRAYVLEFLGVFALVYFSAGVICVNYLTVGEDPSQQAAPAASLLARHPGLLGIAVAQGFILAAALAVTMHVSGGYLNPAVTIMLWVFGRMEGRRAIWLLGAQFIGAMAAGLCLRFTCAENALIDARIGTPHLNPMAFHPLNLGSLITGTSIELLLTFFLVFAIFGTIRKKSYWQDLSATSAKAGDPAGRSVEARLSALMAGITLVAGILFAGPLTGAATNPARWFGTVIWEALFKLHPTDGAGPFADALVYVAGPILGALLAGLVFLAALGTVERREVGKKK